MGHQELGTNRRGLLLRGIWGGLAVLFYFTSLQRTFYVLAIPIIVTCLLYWGQIVLMPVALAILLAFVLTTPMEWLERHGFRRAFSGDRS